MGVMHHAAFLQKFEDARVDWLRSVGLSSFHHPKYDLVLAVISAQVNYVKPCQFDQAIKIKLIVKKDRLKLTINYLMYNEQMELLAEGSTTHVPMNKDLKIIKYPQPMLEILNKECQSDG